MVKDTLFQCPSCSKALKQGEKQYFCPNGHSFDIARKGYVNLLLPCHTGAGEPGDSKEMIQSRRRFLERGYYEGFSDRLNDAAVSALAAGAELEKRISILDAGCGEGYYTARLKSRLAGSGSPGEADVYGIDVSKPAVQYAAARDKDLRLAVASNYHVPVLNNSLDCVLCAFAPRDEREFSRILKPSGRLIVAAPGPKHLFSFRKMLYGNPDIIGQKGTVGEGFMLLGQDRVAYDMYLKSTQDILDLLMMTPYSRHTDPETVESLKKLDEFATEVDFNIMVYRKL